MAKETGLGAQFYIDTIDLSGDTREVKKLSKSQSPIEMTGINKSAKERKSGQLDGEFNWTVFFNPTNAHLTLEDLPRTDRIVSYYHRATVGVPAASMVGKQINYDGTRATSGELTLDVQALANAYWVDWGLALTAAAQRTDTSATNGPAVDFTATSAFGLQAYLHVLAFTGTSATIKLQSDDNSGFTSATDVTGGGFTLVTGVTSERIQTARNAAIERYLRVITTGTFSNLVFGVMASVNRTDQTI